MEYVLFFSLLLLILYGIWFFRNILKSGRSKKIHREYQSILDQKLKPLGFEKKEALVGGREKIASYKRNALEVNLSYEISYDTNRITLTNARNRTSINLSDSKELKSNFLQTLEK
jgi:hypothetical protein